MRAWFSGKTSAFQADDGSSILPTRSQLEMTRRTMTRYTKRRGKILSRYLRILGVNLIL